MLPCIHNKPDNCLHCTGQLTNGNKSVITMRISTESLLLPQYNYNYNQ